jgi:hypothetical protein
MRADLAPGGYRASGLVDVLDRVLDKGLAIAGDIKISLAEVELLTIRIRLIVCSIDKAQEIGLDWWKHDEHFGRAGTIRETQALRRQVAELEARVARLAGDGRLPAAPRRRVRRGGSAQRIPRRGTDAR